jgi:PAS domain S-box-containing protein
MSSPSATCGDSPAQSDPELPLEAAKRTSSLLRTVLDSAADLSIIASTPDHLITVFNHGAECLLGYDSAEMVDTATVAVIHDGGEIVARGAALSIALERTVQGIGVLTDPATLNIAREWTYIRKDGSHVPVSLVVSAMHGDSGDVTGYVGIARDITQRHEQERSLQDAMTRAERANAAKSQFLANMSHEIRTPLNAVIGLGYLLEQTPLSASQRSFLTKIQFAGRSLLSVVNNVLDLSKIEAGEMTLEDTVFDLPELVRELQQMLAPTAQSKGIGLLVSPSADLPRLVWGDATRVRQIITNLLNNAIKFTESGQVDLELSWIQQDTNRIRVRCCVRDTGIGVATEGIARLFAPFTQADASTTRRFGGTGLGLSIARRLVELMGGEIGANSVLGVGSEFWAQIPLRMAHESEFDGQRDHARPLQVLIVEPQDALQPLEALTRPLGWHPYCVTLGEDAVARLHSGNGGSWPDVMLIDGHLPDIDALQLMARFRKEFPNLELPPVVVLVDQVETYLPSLSLQGTVAAVLGRPVTSSTLFNAVNAALAIRAGDRDSVLQATHFDKSGARWLQGAQILVVDDSEINLDVAQNILQQQGATVATSCNGAEAVALLRKAPDAFDIVLMDVQMPELDGNEATWIIRNELLLHALPVVGLTAGALVSERERSLEAGMNEFLSKPFDPVALIRVVRRFVEQKRGAPLPVCIGTAPERRPGLETGYSNIDSKVARQMFGEDTGLFTSLLARVLRDFPEFIVPGVGFPDPAARKQFCLRLHKFRGSAGVVGAHIVHRLAGAAEEALETGQPREIVESLLQQLAAAFTALGEEVQPMLDVNAAKVAMAARESSASPPATQATIQDLLELLDGRDLQALDRFTAVASSLSVTLGGARFAQLRAAIEGLDFEVAAELLRGAALTSGSKIRREGTSGAG